MNPDPPTIENQISKQLGIIRDALQVWADANGGKAFVCSDMQHLWQMAWADSIVPRCLIAFESEEARGEFSVSDQISGVNRTFAIGVTRGNGFNAEPGDSVTEQAFDARPFADLFEEARDICRSLRGLTMDDGLVPLYKGARRMQMGDLIADGWLIEIQTLNFIEKVN